MNNISERKKEVLRKYALFKDLMAEKGCTVSDVCQNTGVDHSTLSHWKAGDYTPGTQKMIAICEYFEVPIKYFYEDISKLK